MNELPVERFNYTRLLRASLIGDVCIRHITNAEGVLDDCGVIINNDETIWSTNAESLYRDITRQLREGSEWVHVMYECTFSHECSNTKENK